MEATRAALTEQTEMCSAWHNSPVRLPFHNNAFLTGSLQHVWLDIESAGMRICIVAVYAQFTVVCLHVVLC